MSLGKGSQLKEAMATLERISVIGIPAVMQRFPTVFRPRVSEQQRRSANIREPR